MTLGLIAILVAVVIVYRMRESLGRPKAHALLGVLLVAGIVLMGFTVHRELTGGANIAEPVHASPGFVLGREISAAFPDGGTVIAFDFAPGQSAEKRIYHARLDGLRQGLDASRFEVVSATSRLTPQDLASLDGSMLPLDSFQDAADQHPGAVAMVSFLGLPRARKVKDLAALPSIYAVELNNPGAAQAYVQKGLIPAAVCYLPTADWRQEPERGAGAEDVFAMFYVLLTKNSQAGATR